MTDSELHLDTATDELNIYPEIHWVEWGAQLVVYKVADEIF
jgi:hypothetical protein